MKVFIHYNAADFTPPEPQLDRWHNYTNPDSAKMFLVCADSWRKQGFEPVRLNSSFVQNNGFVFHKHLLRVFEYPIEFWNVWFLLRRLSPCLFTTTDVINYGLSVSEYSTLVSGFENTPFCFNKTNNWTNSCMYVTRGFCDYVIQLIKNVDAGVIPIPGCVVTTDESIIRERASFKWHVYTAYMNSNEGLPCLVHYHRSMLFRALESFPVICF